MPETIAVVPIPDAGRRFPFSGRISLTARILLFNIIALSLMAGSLFFLDSYRSQLVRERFRIAGAEITVAAAALEGQPPGEQRELLGRIAQDRHLRARFYGPDGRLLVDSQASVGPTFALHDPADQPWYLQVARGLDIAVDAMVGAPRVIAYAEPRVDRAAAWPEVGEALAGNQTIEKLRYAPDRTPVISAATPVGRTGGALLTVANPRDMTQAVRDARQTLAIVVALATIVSIQLSLYLARTIVQPLRALMRAAVRVRLGRDRAVIVPRLPERGDEIGLLARAVSDMSASLRERIDAGERFAADVAHELKNPLASLRSALETLERVDEPGLRRQLQGIAAHDVQRIDRLISDIADASRIDAELSRVTFEPVSLRKLIESVIGERRRREEIEGGSPKIIVHGLRHGSEVMGDPARLEQVFENLLDNAVSFSPIGAPIHVTLRKEGSSLISEICDSGPGIPAVERERVFERFHSVRPESEDFGDHSGLGLAIARTIAEAHEGSLSADDRRDGKPGAMFVLALPALDGDARLHAQRGAA